jgi:hypothetical protein
MSNQKATGCIRIVKTPLGEAPEEIRHAWVGLFLPCLPILGYSDGNLYGVVTRKVVPQCYGFHVPQDLAIQALEQGQWLGAVKWWKDHGFPHPGNNFIFDEDEAEIISGVTRQKLTEVTDEAQGNPFR